MTGPEHYKEAERLLATSDANDVAAAQVHATLALAAATVGVMPDMQDQQQWSQVA